MENVCLLWLLAVKTACVSTFQQPWPISCPKVETGMSGHDFSRNSLHKAVCAVKTAKEPPVCPVSQNAKRALGRRRKICLKFARWQRRRGSLYFKDIQTDRKAEIRGENGRKKLYLLFNFVSHGQLYPVKRLNKAWRTVISGAVCILPPNSIAFRRAR